MINRFILATLIVVGLGSAALLWLVRSHTDRIVLTHASVLSNNLFSAARTSHHLNNVFYGEPLGYLYFGPFAEQGFDALLAKYIFLDRDGNFIIAKDIRTDEVIETPRGTLTAERLMAWYQKAIADEAELELVQYSPLHGAEGRYAQSMHVIEDTSGERLGGMLLLLDVHELENAYKTGLTTFASLLTLLGCALFALPTAAYAMQRAHTSQSRKDARYLAQHDSLTGLLNRGAFMKKANAQAEAGDLYGIAYIDVDRFKSVNDTKGHAAGDLVLATLAQTMRQVFAKDALLARFGGDEFVIGVMTPPDVRAPEAAQDNLHKLGEQFTRASVDARIGVTVSISAGYAAKTRSMTVEDTMARADLALYTAKTGGRDGVAVYSDEMGEALKRRQFIEHLLQSGMSENRFKLYYQPLVEAAGKTVAGYEALLRLTGPDGEFVSPAEFIPIAESMGLINTLGEWVLRTATQAISDLDGDPFIAINLSVEQFKSGNIVATVKDALFNSGLPPERLELEITESLLIEDQHGVSMSIDALKDLGVSVAMDDFGTGFSSLSYLWKYGFDRIKIDRSFVQALELNRTRSVELIESIVLLGARLGMKVTAEGIETKEQAQMLANLGCDHLQGFYFGRPAPLDTQEETSTDLHIA
ncbi:MAG: bifunctional diguanylate cyclase/phosphodiesterase [Pseudomonadota bacterium]